MINLPVVFIEYEDKTKIKNKLLLTRDKNCTNKQYCIVSTDIFHDVSHIKSFLANVEKEKRFYIVLTPPELIKYKILIGNKLPEYVADYLIFREVSYKKYFREYNRLLKILYCMFFS